MVDVIIGIDPGRNGGIAVKIIDGEEVAYKMPKDLGELAKILKGYGDKFGCLAVLEKLSIRPDDVTVQGGEKNMGKAFRIQKMLAGFEALKTTLTLLGIPFVMVHPMKWQSALGLRIKGEDKAVRKKRYRDVASVMFTSLRVTMWNCDALLLCVFGLKMLQEGRGWLAANLPKEYHSKVFSDENSLI